MTEYINQMMIFFERREEEEAYGVPSSCFDDMQVLLTCFNFYME